MQGIGFLAQRFIEFKPNAGGAAPWFYGEGDSRESEQFLLQEVCCGLHGSLPDHYSRIVTQHKVSGRSFGGCGLRNNWELFLREGGAICCVQE
jgi:hypothetical protein